MSAPTKDAPTPAPTARPAPGCATTRRLWEAYRRRALCPPVSPGLAEYLVPALSRNKLDVETLGVLVETDLALSLAVLDADETHSGAEAFGPEGIRASVQRLGWEGARAVVLAQTTQALYNPETTSAMRRIRCDYEDRCRRALVTAHLSRALAENVARPDAGLCYAVGLFSQLGRLLATYTLGVMSIQDNRLARLSTAERAPIFERLAPAIGADFLKRSGLPEVLIAELGELQADTRHTAQGPAGPAVLAGALLEPASGRPQIDARRRAQNLELSRRIGRVDFSWNDLVLECAEARMAADLLLRRISLGALTTHG